MLLGPVAVAASRGIGAALVRKAIRHARKAGHGAIVLVGDPPYYGRFGFTAEKTAGSAARPFERAGRGASFPQAADNAGGLIPAAGTPRKIAAHALRKQDNCGRRESFFRRSLPFARLRRYEEVGES